MADIDLETAVGADAFRARSAIGRIQSILEFDSIAELEAATIPAFIQRVMLRGAYGPGDAGPPMYARRVNRAPTAHKGYRRSVDRFKANTNVIFNGDFSESGGFTLFNATISGGQLSVNTGGLTFLVQSNVLTSGVVYNFSFDLNVTNPPDRMV